MFAVLGMLGCAGSATIDAAPEAPTEVPPSPEPEPAPAPAPAPEPEPMELCGADGRLGSDVGTLQHGDTCDGFDDIPTTCGVGGGLDYRWRWVAPADGEYEFATHGSSFVPTIEVRDACGEALVCGEGSAIYPMAAGQEVDVTVDGSPDVCGPYFLSVVDVHDPAAAIAADAGSYAGAMDIVISSLFLPDTPCAGDFSVEILEDGTVQGEGELVCDTGVIPFAVEGVVGPGPVASGDILAALPIVGEYAVDWSGTVFDGVLEGEISDAISYAQVHGSLLLERP